MVAVEVTSRRGHRLAERLVVALVLSELLVRLLRDSETLRRDICIYVWLFLLVTRPVV
ncbi:MAG: hypothetical protein U5K28_02330 [Halobacteriales archaeon]|nr:hypothetical protein [Halobacteriales archaeon]